MAEKYSYCPIILGVNFLDQIRTIEKFEKIRFNKISFPLLVLPFLSRSSEIIGKRISCPEIANNVEMNIIENKDNFSEQEWKSLYKISEETFVEESDSLKQGAAGAGLTDND